MGKFVCTVCGFVYEGDAAPDECPVCHQPASKFREEPAENAQVSDLNSDSKEPEGESGQKSGICSADLEYDKNFYRIDKSCRYMEEIHQMAVTGKTIGGSMGTRMPMPNWDDILLLGAQLNPAPLADDAPVSTMTVIGKHAKKTNDSGKSSLCFPYVFWGIVKRNQSGACKRVSYGKTAMCSGEGGILPEEREASYKYIFEYIPNKYSVTDENLRNADAIEIKIGQGTKPGMGGHLPGEKVTEEIAALRGKKPGEDIQSPSKFAELNTKEDLKEMVTMLRNRSDGRPIGIKIAAGRIERDLEFCVFAEPDFITIDGRGGATGSSPLFLREATTVPTIYALYRARKYLDSVKSDISLVITGGLRISADVAKALAMGADAVAVASAALIAAACQQYRICGSGNCPVGIATQNPALRERLKVEQSAQRVANYLNVTLAELKSFARITGHSSVHDLSVDDLVTINREISEFTNIRHA